MKKCPSCGSETGIRSTSCGVCGHSFTPEPVYIIKAQGDNKSKSLPASGSLPTNPTQSQDHIFAAQSSLAHTITAKTEKASSILNDEAIPKKAQLKIMDQKTKKSADEKNMPGLHTLQNNKSKEAKDEQDNNASQAAAASEKSTPASALPLLRMILPDANHSTKENTTSSQNSTTSLTWEEVDDEKLAHSSTMENIHAVIIRPIINAFCRFFFNTKDETGTFAEEDIKENCNFGVLSYLAYLFFIPMIAKPYSRYLRFHGNQGLTLFLSTIALEAVNLLLNFTFSQVFSVNGALSGPGVFLTVLATVFINGCILLWITIGIFNTVKGKARELPIIGRFRLLK